MNHSRAPLSVIEKLDWTTIPKGVIRLIDPTLNPHDRVKAGGIATFGHDLRYLSFEFNDKVFPTSRNVHNALFAHQTNSVSSTSHAASRHCWL
jgi:hypothetical protein